MGGRMIGVGVLVSVLGSSGAMGQGFPIRVLSGVNGYGKGVASPWTGSAYPGVFSGDFDGDGVEDVGVLSRDPIGGDDLGSVMEIFHGDGAGGFGSSVRPWGSLVKGLGGIVESATMFVNDQNGDGRDDLVLLMVGSPYVVMLLAEGDGFVEAARFSFGVDDEILSSHVIDVDGDGDLDVLFDYENDAAMIDGVLRVFLWNGVNAYVEGKGISAPVFYPSEIRLRSYGATDFDGDGDRDLVLSLAGSTFVNTVWLVEHEGGVWSGAREVDVPESVEDDSGKAYFRDSIPAIADVNGDGEADLVYSAEYDDGDTQTGALVVFESPLSEPIEDRARIIDLRLDALEFSIHGIDISRHMVESVGDLDGDGTEDVVIGARTSALDPAGGSYDPMLSGWRVTDVLGVNQRFALAPDVRVHGAGLGSSDGLYEFPHRVFIDVNGDGVRDRVMATRWVTAGMDGEAETGTVIRGVLADGRISGTGRAENFRGGDAIGSNSQPNFIGAVDLDLDGLPELIGAEEEFLRLYARDAAGRFVYCNRERFSAPGDGFRIETARFDADPVPDLISMDAGSAWFLPAVYLNESYLCSPTQNVNHDGVDWDGTIDALAQSGIEMGFPVGSAFASGDLDGDGFDDFAYVGRLGLDTGFGFEAFEGVLTWVSDGSGGFMLTGAASVTDRFSDLGIVPMAMIDRDGDGDLDVVVCDELVGEQERIIAMLNDGSGGIVTESEPVMVNEREGFVFYWMDVADVDGDGWDDLVVLLTDAPTRPSEHEIRIFYGGESGLSGETSLIRGAGALEVMCADLDGDGLLELLTCSNSEDGRYRNTVSIVYQGSARVFDPPVSMNLEDGAGAGVYAADLDNDGSAELISTGGISTLGLTIFWSNGAPCASDLNLDGDLDFFDVSAFLGYYSESEPIADFNGDGAFDFFDLSAFLGAFAAGCP